MFPYKILLNINYNNIIFLLFSEDNVCILNYFHGKNCLVSLKIISFQLCLSGIDAILYYSFAKWKCKVILSYIKIIKFILYFYICESFFLLYFCHYAYQQASLYRLLLIT